MTRLSSSNIRSAVLVLLSGMLGLSLACSLSLSAASAAAANADAHAAEALGGAFRVAPEHIRKLDEYGADTAGSSVDRRGKLPVPAALAIDASGEVAWSGAIPDYRERVASEKILEVAGMIAPE